MTNRAEQAALIPTLALALSAVTGSGPEAAEQPHTKVIEHFTCSGKVGNNFAGIADHSIGSGDNMCYFVSQSADGRRILKTCTIGTNCQVVGTVINDEGVGDWSPIITDVISVIKISN
jgi:hypothetical protein